MKKLLIAIALLIPVLLMQSCSLTSIEYVDCTEIEGHFSDMEMCNQQYCFYLPENTVDYHITVRLHEMSGYMEISEVEGNISFDKIDVTGGFCIEDMGNNLRHFYYNLIIYTKEKT